MIFSLRQRVGWILPFALVLTMAVSCSNDDDDDDSKSNNFTLNGAGSSDTELAGAAPTSATMGIYQFAVSEQEDCSDPQVIINNGDDAVDFDMMAEPELGTGTIPDGTYPCVILVMSPQLTVVPSEDKGVCEAGETIKQNVCGGKGSEGRTIDLDGKEHACDKATTPAYLYLTTMSTLTDEYQESNDNCSRDKGDDSSCNSFEPPTADNEALGVPLGAALVVDGSAVGVFTLGNLRVDEEGDHNDPDCGLRRPSFTFKTTK